MRRFEKLSERLALSAAPVVEDVHVAGTDWDSAFVDRLESDGLGTGGYQIPTGSSAQTAALPWDNVDKIMIQFNEDVNVDENDLSISGVNATTHGVDEFFYDAVAKRATWTLSNPMPIDKTQLDLNGDNLDPVVDLDGNILDGDWVNNATSGDSGNGIAGGDFEFLVNFLPGDVNQSGMVDSADLTLVSSHLWLDASDPNYEPLYDINADGIMYQDDFWLTVQYGQSILPLGDPAGVSNDAPASDGFDLLSVTSAYSNYYVSLNSVFEDIEDGDNLTYSIDENSDPSLFDALTINQSTGILTVSTAPGNSGRGFVEVSATDSGGLSVASTLAVDALVNNQTPVVLVDTDHLAPGLWKFYGTVTDADDAPAGWIVELTGEVEQRITVQSDGTFSWTTVLPESTNGIVMATVEDPHGASDDDYAAIH